MFNGPTVLLPTIPTEPTAPEIPVYTTHEYVVAALLSANTRAKLDRAICVFDLAAPCQYQWEKAVVEVEAALEAMCLEICERNLARENIPLSVMSDCGWNFRGFSSPMGNVTVIGTESKRILAVCPLVAPTRHANYEGTARGMEGEGTRRICQWLQHKKYNIGTFLHDGDSSSYKAVLESFPEAAEHFGRMRLAKPLSPRILLRTSSNVWKRCWLTMAASTTIAVISLVAPMIKKMR